MTQPTPFWTEGLEPHERERKVHQLLRDHLGSDATSDGLFVFAPDPPPQNFDNACQQVPNTSSVQWGKRGRAALTTSYSDAEQLAPVMFDLWSDKLYVVYFPTHPVGMSENNQWIEAVLGDTELGREIGEWRLAIFDWGDFIRAEHHVPDGPAET